jgi:hypothetical protein
LLRFAVRIEKIEGEQVDEQNESDIKVFGKMSE